MTVTSRGRVAVYLEHLKELLDAVSPDRVEAVGATLVRAYWEHRSVFIAGNGGSAATASHLACDLRKNAVDSASAGFQVTCLNDNLALVTALANDLGFESVFVEQIRGSAAPGDVVIVISGSGRSPNVVEALKCARERAATTVALLGFDGGDAAALADHVVLVPGTEYGPVEDVHMALGHAVTEYVKAALARPDRDQRAR
jgi:D-sedoheptulose 7-phosphate isomerase